MATKKNPYRPVELIMIIKLFKINHAMSVLSIIYIGGFGATLPAKSLIHWCENLRGQYSSLIVLSSAVLIYVQLLLILLEVDNQRLPLQCIYTICLNQLGCYTFIGNCLRPFCIRSLSSTILLSELDSSITGEIDTTYKSYHIQCFHIHYQVV